MGRAFLRLGHSQRTLLLLAILTAGTRGQVGMLRLRNEIASRFRSFAQHDKR
jgi:hypothetical protein